MRRHTGWSYEYEAFFLEIYNETIRDLLVETKPSAQKVIFFLSFEEKRLKKNKFLIVKGKQAASEESKHEIKHSADGVTTVTDLTVVKVERPSQVLVLLLLQRLSKG